MRTSKQLRTFAAVSAAAMALGLAACENGDGLDDDGFDDGVEAPADDGLDDDGLEDDGLDDEDDLDG